MYEFENVCDLRESQTRYSSFGETIFGVVVAILCRMDCLKEDCLVIGKREVFFFFYRKSRDFDLKDYLAWSGCYVLDQPSIGL